jgi:hypothetical protein
LATRDRPVHGFSDTSTLSRPISEATIGLRGWCSSNANGLIRKPDIGCLAISLGEGLDATQSKTATASLNPQCGLATIGNQDSFKHARHRPRPFSTFN